MIVSTNLNNTIFVLTDTPGVYGDGLDYNGKSPVFIKEVGALLTQLKDVTVAGLVLELPKVMKATRKERDRLFQYAGIFPVMRTKLNARHGFVSYLDPKALFLSNLSAEIGKRHRNHERIKVKLDCAFSKENDPIMADSADATLLDISPGGCCIAMPAPLEDHQFIHLRIPQLTNARPIYCTVRWTRPMGDDPESHGMGVMFIDLTDGQAEEIQALQLTAQVRQ